MRPASTYPKPPSRSALDIQTRHLVGAVHDLLAAAAAFAIVAGIWAGAHMLWGM